LKLGFLNGKGPAAEGKAVGPSLKLEVDLRRKNSEHAMHPVQGAADNIEDAYGDAPPPPVALQHA